MMTISRIQILDVQKGCSPDEIRGADCPLTGKQLGFPFDIPFDKLRNRAQGAAWAELVEAH